MGGGGLNGASPSSRGTAGGHIPGSDMGSSEFGAGGVMIGHHRSAAGGIIGGFGAPSAAAGMMLGSRGGAAGRQPWEQPLGGALGGGAPPSAPANDVDRSWQRYDSGFDKKM